MTVRFCANNAGALVVVRRLENEHPRLRVRSEDCLRKCGICREAPFVLVDGEVVAAVTPEELYQELVARLGGAGR